MFFSEIAKQSNDNTGIHKQFQERKCDGISVLSLLTVKIKLNKHLKSSWSLHVKLYGKSTRQIWAFDYVFCPHRWEFDNGFRPHRRKFDRIFFKSQIPGGSPGGGMIAVGIDSYII